MFARLFRKLAPAIGLYLMYSCILTGLARAVTGPEARAISGVVETLEGTPLQAVEVRLTNSGSATTSEFGKFSISLSQRLEPGDPIDVSLGEDWLVTMPWQGKGFIPASLSEILHIRVAH